MLQWSENGESMVDVILTSGGTGFGLRDNTPEVIKPLLHREVYIFVLLAYMHYIYIHTYIHTYIHFL